MSRGTVFISYSRKDLGRVRALADDLRYRGIDVWFDIYHLLPGQKWERQIKRVIPECKYFLICVSRVMMKQTYAHAELRDAFKAARRLPDGQIYIVPVILDRMPSTKLPSGLREYQYERLVGNPGSPGWQKSVARILTALGAPSDSGCDDYRAIAGRYHAHVFWWLLGRAIRPNKASRKTPARFGSAQVSEYMIPFEKDRILVCGPRSLAYGEMVKMLERLYPNPETLAGDQAPVLAVLEDPDSRRSKFLGIVTPSDLLAKWDYWYVKRKSRIRPHVWFKDPRACSPRDTVRDAYEKMGTILTGLPVVQPRSGRLVGFLPHPGTREDLSP